MRGIDRREWRPVSGLSARTSLGGRRSADNAALRAVLNLVVFFVGADGRRGRNAGHGTPRLRAAANAVRTPWNLMGYGERPIGD
jgi:hypothetical protein